MNKGVKYTVSGILILAMVVGIMIVGGGFSRQSVDLKSLPTVRAQRGLFKVTIDELGIFEAEKKVLITAPFSGKVLKIIPDGSEVKAGQTVIWLDAEDITDDLENQITQLKSVKMDLEQSIAQLLDSIKNNTIDTELSQAELEFSRLRLLEANQQLETLEILKENSLVPRRDLDDAARKVEKEKLSTKSNDLTYKEKVETLLTEEVINQQKLEDINTKGGLSQQKIKDYLSKINLAEIKAPKDGIFVLIKRWNWRLRKIAAIQEGDEVHRNHQLAEIPDLSTLQLMSQVSERFINRVYVGMPVNIVIDALGSDEIPGKISSIGRVAIERSHSPAGELSTISSSDNDLAEKVFEVVIELSQYNQSIRPGMSAQVSFILEEIPDAVYVPIKSVFAKNGKSFVYKFIDRKYRRVEVITGEKNKSNVVIQKGVQAGDILFMVDIEEEV